MPLANVFIVYCHSQQGAWMEFESDIRDCIHVRIDRTRKLPVTVLVRALDIQQMKRFWTTIMMIII